MLAETMYRAAAQDHVRMHNDRAILAAVLMPDVNLAVWQRNEDLPSIASVDLSSVDDVALTSSVATLSGAVRRALSQAGYPGSAAPTIAADIASLGRALAQVVDCDTLAIRLEVIESDACRRFHADYVSARLICTYLGPATQWLADTDAVALRNGADVESLPIQQLETGDVAIFKGRQWSPDHPIVHRSPPIAGTGQQRLVLVIDPAPDEPIPHA